LTSKGKLAIASLSLSVAGFVGILASEGYSDKAYVPVKGDVHTLGFGSTKLEDGTPVGANDKTDPVRALFIAKAHMEKDEEAFRKTLEGVKLTQKEYDTYFDFTYQYGIGNWRKSQMLKDLKAGEYKKACSSLLQYRFVAKRDCSIRANNCYGVWTRQQKRFDDCMGEQ
jgi:lysozyme